MRIWHPIPPLCLDRQRLLGEHRELHCIWTVIIEGKRGYSRHPETVRWREHLPALRARHELLVREMLARGWRHQSPLVGYESEDVVWPDVLESVEVMRGKLARKLGGRDEI